MPPILRRTAPVFACVVALALAGPVPASAARFAPGGAAAEALRLSAAFRHSAAETLLASHAWPQDSATVLDAGAAELEYARLVARAEALGMCDTTWTWRPARVEAALVRFGAERAVRDRAALARARVEFRLGRWRTAAALAQELLARLAPGRRDDLLRLEASLLRVEALSVENVIEPRAEWRRADSLARVLGDAAAPHRARLLRTNANLWWLEGRLPDAARGFADAVKAADATSPVPEGEACIALVLQGTLESFTDAPLGDRHKSEAAMRAEARLGFTDERALLVLGRSVANLRDPARLPAADAKFEDVHRLLRERGMTELAGAWNVDYFHSRVCHYLLRYDRARELLTHALALAQRWSGPDNIREMYTCIDMGNSWYVPRDGLRETAFPWWRRAVAVGLTLPPTYVNDPNVTRVNLAQALGEQGQIRESRVESEAIWKSYAARDGETTRLLVPAASLAARTSRALGDTAAAELWYGRAMKPFEANDSGEREEVAQIRESRALFEYWRGQEARAFDLAVEPARLRRQVVEETAPWLPDGDALRFATNRRVIAGLLTTLALRGSALDAERMRQAWLTLVSDRSAVLEAMLRRARVQADTSAAARAAGALRRELATQVLAALRAPDTREAQARRDSLRGEIRRRELGAPAPGMAREDLTVESASRRLGADGVLVSYTRFGRFDRADSRKLAWTPRDTYAAFVLRGGDAVPVAIELGPADTLDAALAAYRAALVAGGDSPAARAAGARVRALAWDPLARAIAGRAHVYVVPESELQKLNWYALPTGRDRFLADEPLVLHRLGSERDLVAPATAPGDGVLALGGLEYGAGPAAAAPPAAAPVATRRLLPSCRSFLDERFTALPASLGEARAVASLGRRFTRDSTRVALLDGAAADEAAFKRLAPGRRVVHLATHAFFLGADCANGTAAADVLSRNPLVFSGIALANANAWRDAPARGGEDGLLTAEELAGMRLEGVEWLVLSGCESGMGQVQAWEGVYGLPRAARMAGVHTLVVSLLPVDDDASRRFMQALYDARFAHDEPTAVAIRTASRRVLGWLRAARRPADPRLWAAFVALGE
ncbi:MAG: CHAT domain-containing protein [Candidatus Eisenbacteria bacterium]